MHNSADYLEKARNSYVGARACLERQAFDSCVSRCYYTVFQGAIAALIQLTDFRPAGGEWSHKTTQAEFNRRLVMRRKVFSGEIGRTLLTLIEWRHRADYAPTSAGRQIARTSAALAEAFLTAIQDQLGGPHGPKSKPS
ncbi:MAG: HEPN domain-containing protein [Deltaproteobacteria bacterium]|nr:HEPN domain-containing protein [Deltaproteobacteria bacterium]